MATKKENKGIKDQFAALRNLPRFFSMIWATSRAMTLGNVFLRLVKSAIPLAMLYVGKEIIDQVILLMDDPGQAKDYLWLMVGIELALAVVSDIISRGITLLDGLLG
ncbi:MAG: ABC transporter ATP-binding protein, partial [Saprospiraceae bacterium]|nr:ABC transporter ATP-binding protein [Saprospiraceae bacterium]